MRLIFGIAATPSKNAYEFMLAYAAQGLPSDVGSTSGGRDPRVSEGGPWLRRPDWRRALLPRSKRKVSSRPTDTTRSLPGSSMRDASDSIAAIQLVLAQPIISSQLIDNLNASIHLRALLTDLFLVSEILKARPTGGLGAHEQGQMTCTVTAELLFMSNWK